MLTEAEQLVRTLHSTDEACCIARKTHGATCCQSEGRVLNGMLCGLNTQCLLPDSDYYLHITGPSKHVYIPTEHTCEHNANLDWLCCMQAIHPWQMAPSATSSMRVYLALASLTGRRSQQ